MTGIKNLKSKGYQSLCISYNPDGQYPFTDSKDITLNVEHSTNTRKCYVSLGISSKVKYTTAYNTTYDTLYSLERLRADWSN